MKNRRDSGEEGAKQRKVAIDSFVIQSMIRPFPADSDGLRGLSNSTGLQPPMYAETTGNASALPQRLPEEFPDSCATPPDAAAPAWRESPSLAPWIPGESPAFEMKFLLVEEQARDVERRIAPHLSPDPYADPKLRNAYHISTIYCDTPDFEVFHRLGSHRSRKYRLRRYGNEPLVFLERKTKRGERVRKRRAKIDDREVATLSAFSTEADWPGHWFHKQLVRRRLEPVCGVQYLRTAYVGTGDEGALRLTFDRDVRGHLVNDWAPALSGDGIAVLTGQVVCEFKFRGNLPALFKGAIQDLALEPTGVSKFRYCFEAAGGATNGSPGNA